MNNYEPVVGLEIHVELKTLSKMFCQCSADYFGKKPNSNTCPVCLGMPGALPVPNKKAVEWTILIGKALNCTINESSKFDRKHYFYPDLPKGYQISQYDEPIAVKGSLEVGGKKFGITRVHLEEDTGKLMHEGQETLVDFNRSGVPLVEIVTEPDFRNSDDVKKFLEELHAIIESLGVSDADMEKGSMRLEPNISVRKVGEKELPKYKVEVKNINSFNFVKRAVDYEIGRHIKLLEDGTIPPQETRGYVEKTSSTVSQRSKEEAHDYRYFPEPDIPPMMFTQKYIDSIEVPELPEKRYKTIVAYGVKNDDAYYISRNIKLTNYFKEVMREFTKLRHGSTKMIDIKVINNELEQKKLGQIIANLIKNKRISIELNPKEFASRANLASALVITDKNKLESLISDVIEKNPKVIADFKSGKQNAVMYLVGQVMREMKGQADANTVKAELLKRLEN